MLKKVLSTCVVTCALALSTAAQSKFNLINLENLNMDTAMAVKIPLGIQLTTATTPQQAGNMATGYLGLGRRNYVTQSFTGNDMADQVGLWLKGYYQGYGGSMPVFIGGNGYNSEHAGLTVASNGNVGIGMTNPSAKLEVAGDLYLSDPHWDASVGWATTNIQYFGHSLVIGSKPGNYAHNVIDFKPGGSDQGEVHSHLNMYTATGLNTQQLKIHLSSDGLPNYFNSGPIGIGTEHPLSLLSVKGEITAQKVRVTGTGWADFVFAPDYVLPSLQGLAAFIKAHQHLPEIPSAATVEKEGIELGEMNKKLLQKIEELTLYIIRQDEQLAEVQARLKKLEEKE